MANIRAGLAARETGARFEGIPAGQAAGADAWRSPARLGPRSTDQGRARTDCHHSTIAVGWPDDLGDRQDHPPEPPDRLTAPEEVSRVNILEYRMAFWYNDLGGKAR